MLDELSWEEFQLWSAFETLEPWGPNAAFHRSAAVARAAILPHLKKGAALPEAEDVFPHLKTEGSTGAEDRDPASEAERLKVMGWVAACGGTVVRAG